MKALVFRRAGEPRDVLEYAEVPEPVLMDGHVVVRVAMGPVHPADLAFIRGQYRVKPDFPQVAGLEAVGTIVAAPAKAPFAPGTWVAFRYPGAWAEQASVPFEHLIAVPSGVTAEQACQVSLNPVTAYALLDEARAAPGQWIVQTAAASTVSNVIATMAQARGIGVIGLVRGSAVAAKSRCIANNVLSVDEVDLAAAVAAITGGDKPVALLDSVGGTGVVKLFGLLAPGSRVIVYGVQDRSTIELTNATLIYANLTWKGFGIDRWLMECPSDRKTAMFASLWQMIANGTLSLPVAATFPLARFQEALEADVAAGRSGKVLLSV
jgi:NADPH:quinone reductase-like Zn-dependent oxidoreductase